MAAVKQDSAPKGGYPEFRFERHLPRRGPSGVVLLLGGAAVMAVGLARVAKGNRQRRLVVMFNLLRCTRAPLLFVQFRVEMVCQ